MLPVTRSTSEVQKESELEARNNENVNCARAIWRAFCSCLGRLFQLLFGQRERLPRGMQPVQTAEVGTQTETASVSFEEEESPGGVQSPDKWWLSERQWHSLLIGEAPRGWVRDCVTGAMTFGEVELSKEEQLRLVSEKRSEQIVDFFEGKFISCKYKFGSKEYNRVNFDLLVKLPEKDAHAFFLRHIFSRDDVGKLILPLTEEQVSTHFSMNDEEGKKRCEGLLKWFDHFLVRPLGMELEKVGEEYVTRITDDTEFTKQWISRMSSDDTWMNEYSERFCAVPCVSA